MRTYYPNCGGTGISVYKPFIEKIRRPGDFTDGLIVIPGKGDTQNEVMTRKIGVHVKYDPGLLRSCDRAS
jgi:hypothetical protein